jgi:hypothetical protein
MVDGISRAMGRLCTEDKLKEETINAANSFGVTTEILRALRSGTCAQAIWSTLGGCIGISQATVLLAILCKHSRELGQFFDGQASGISETREGRLREMRKREFSPSSPQGFRLSEQQSEQLRNFMFKLSQERAPIKETLGLVAGFTGSPLAHGIPDRVGKLRGYGNAIVPAVAAEFIKAFMEVR